MQAYFPVSNTENPTIADLEAGWQRVVAELRAYSLEQNRNILFTELGYNQSYTAAAQPWDYGIDDEGAQAIQQLCWISALDAIAREPYIVGSLLWKWFPHPRPIGRNFQLATPPIMRIIADAWQGAVPAMEFNQEAFDQWRQQRSARRRRQPE